MCGIGGFFACTPQSPNLAQRMLLALRQRGPDAQHVQTWDADFKPLPSNEAATHALVHTRLAIIDPRPEADQPMGNESGDVWLSYNGEVYNWQDDAQYLRQQGAVFTTRSDTEFILRAYEHWGISMLSRLRGKFALAILDIRRQQLWLATDRLGLKSVVYSSDQGNFAFASLVRALLPCLPADRRDWSAAALDAYLAHRYIPSPMTVFAHIQRLPAAHYLHFDLRTRAVDIKPYWPEGGRPSPSNWITSLNQSIDLRTVADRPVGLFLSGGIDSTVVAAHLAQSGHRDMTAFTASFPGSSFDESLQAMETARRLQLPTQIIPIPEHIGHDFRRMVADLDEPFADPSAIPLWYLSRETVKFVKVVLSGDGGDELLGGYKRYQQHLRSAWRGDWCHLPWGVSATPYTKGWRKWQVEAGLSWRDAYALRFSGLTPGQRLFLQPDREIPAHYWRMPTQVAAAPLQQLLDIDRMNALPDYILRKADLCTMSQGLELRAPMLDYRFVEALDEVDPALRYTTPPKQLLAEACPLLRELGLLNAKKRGFNPPLKTWLNEDLADQFQGLDQRLHDLTQGQFSRVALQSLMSSQQGTRPASDEQLLQLFILDESLRQLQQLKNDEQAW